MLINKFKISPSIAAGMLFYSLISSQAIASTTTLTTSDFLVIATGSGEAFLSGGGEFGADQEITSSGTGSYGIDNIGNDGTIAYQGGTLHNKNLTQSSYDADPNKAIAESQLHGSYHSIGVNTKSDFPWQQRWVENDDKFVDGDTVGKADYLLGAKILSESPDYSGNIALTNASGTFATENTDYFAELGIKCQNQLSSCGDNNDYINDSWKESSTENFKNLHHTQDDTNGGVSNFESGEATALLTELSTWKTYLDDPNLKAEFVIDVKDSDNGGENDKTTFNLIDDENYKDGDGPYKLDLDDIDNGESFTDEFGKTTGNFVDDGIAIIDILTHDQDFSVQYTDWILQTTGSTLAIFRIIGTGNFAINTSSIMMGCSDKGDGHCEDEIVEDLGAIFYTSTAHGNASIQVANSILGGIGLWDLSDDNDHDIQVNNSQGCAQFVGPNVEFSSKNRFNRCSLAAKDTTTEVPEPSTLLLFSSMLLLLTRFKAKKSH